MEEKILSIEELKILSEKIFKNGGKFPVISFLEGHEFIFSNYAKLDNLQKSLALKIICHGQYQENQIAYMQISEDLAAGFALTTDALCIGGNIGNKIFKYSDIVETCAEFDTLLIFVNYEKYKDIIEKERYDKIGWYNERGWHYCFRGISRKKDCYEQIKKFIDVVKNF